MRNSICHVAAIVILAGAMAAVTHAAGDGMQHSEAGNATASGQAAFAAITQIVAVLEADPDTDWAKVDLDALREHLVDMDEVVMRAAASVTRTHNGVEVAVVGDGRTRAAIQRMVPAHARALNAEKGWRAAGRRTPQGATLRVASAMPEQVARIQGLGFSGLLATGAHHQVHHLAIARGQAMHSHQ